MEEVDAADRDRADRVAVIGHAQAHESRALLLALVAPPLEGHLEGDLGGGGPVVGEEHAAQAGRGEDDKPLRELDRGRMGEPQERRVGDAVELGAHGGVDRRVAVAVDVAPQRRDAVDVGVPFGVVERRALGALHDDRRLLPGTGFTIEPGLYFSTFGVRSEINVFYGQHDALITGPVQTGILRLL